MQILLCWKSQTLPEPDASRHWDAILTRWQQRYQELTEHPLHLRQSCQGSLFVGLLSIPDLFREWQEFYEDDSYAIAWSGLSHNLLETFTPHERSQMNSAILGRFEREGDACIRGLEGRFVLALLNRQQEQLHIFTNSYGLTPCFYTEGKYGIAVGTRIAPLLELTGQEFRPNQAALRQMFAVDWCLSEETAFEGVFQAEAGQRLSLNARNPSLEKPLYWSPENILDESRRLARRSDYLELGSDSFKAVIKAQLRHASAPLMDLTGGMDSRVIVSSAVNLGLRPDCAITGVSGASEVQIADQVARALNVPFHQLFPGEQYLENIETNLRLWSLWTEGMIPAHISFAQSAFGLSPALREFYAPYRQTFCGAGGETGRSKYYQNNMIVQKFSSERVISLLQKGLSQRYQETVLFTEQDVQGLRNDLQRCIDEGLSLGLRQPHQLVDYFYWRQRASRWGGYMIDMQQLGRHVFAPLCHSQLTAVFFAMNLKEHLSAAWHKRHIVRMCPGLSAIPFRQDAPLSGLQKKVYEFHPLLFALAWHLNPKKWLLRRHLPYYDEQKQGTYFHTYLQQLLFSKQIWWPEIIPYEIGQRIWENFIAGREVQPLWSLVTIELWGRNFRSQ